jgi:hypothetical protein
MNAIFFNPFRVDVSRVITLTPKSFKLYQKEDVLV